jgi:hypothetical protein
MYEGVHRWPDSQMAFRRTDAISSELIPGKRVSCGD